MYLAHPGSGERVSPNYWEGPGVKLTRNFSHAIHCPSHQQELRFFHVSRVDDMPVVDKRSTELTCSCASRHYPGES